MSIVKSTYCIRAKKSYYWAPGVEMTNPGSSWSQLLPGSRTENGHRQHPDGKDPFKDSRTSNAIGKQLTDVSSVAVANSSQFYSTLRWTEQVSLQAEKMAVHQPAFTETLWTNLRDRDEIETFVLQLQSSYTRKLVVTTASQMAYSLEVWPFHFP